MLKNNDSNMKLFKPFIGVRCTNGLIACVADLCNIPLVRFRAFKFTLTILFGLIPSISLGADDIPLTDNKEGTQCQAILTPIEQHHILTMSQLVKKLKRVPTAEEFAWKLKIPVDQVRGLDFKSLISKGKTIYPSPYQELSPYAARTMASFFLDHLHGPTHEQFASALGVRIQDYNLLYKSPEEYLSLARQLHPRHFESAQKKMTQIYMKLVRQLGRPPTQIELEGAIGVQSSNEIQIFGNYGLFPNSQALKSLVWRSDLKATRDAVDTETFNQERLQNTLEAIANRERLIVVTAVAGATVNRPFFEALLKYCKENDAEILVFPANMVTTGLDPLLLETPGVHVISHTIHLNRWLSLNRIKLIAKQILPLTGLDNIGERGQTQIVGSPKMHMKTLATVDHLLYPHQLMTTGALTDPNYDGQRYIQGRTDEIATRDHVMGALILEKTPGRNRNFDLPTTGHFHLRHIEYIPEIEGFTDLNRVYSAKEKKSHKSNPEALVLGDIHVGDTDPRLMDRVRALVSDLDPAYVITHDLFNGHSISHHERAKLISQSQKAAAGLLNIETELRKAAYFVNSLLQLNPKIKVVITPSNHNDWIYRWVQDGQFMKEPENTRIGLMLAQAMNEGKDPLRTGLEFVGLYAPKRVIWSEQGERFKLGPEERLVELGLHGHQGTNGSKASLKQVRSAALRAVYGHTHTLARINGAVNIGTSTHLQLGYNDGGTSNWVQSLALVSPHGEIQTLQITDGDFYRRSEDLIPGANQFFEPGFPKALPNNEGPSDGTGQIDQYSTK